MLVAAVAGLLYRFDGFQRGVLLIDPILLTVTIVVTRASFRMMNLFAATRSKRSRRVLVYGAGAFGQLLVREMRANGHWRMNPVAFIDDDPAKIRQWIVGVPVKGSIEALETTIRRYRVEEVLLSSPKINGAIEGRIRELCAAMSLPIRRLHMDIS
jgi:FlaA1/EpsC-like NDP-sugar epimerase